MTIARMGLLGALIVAVATLAGRSGGADASGRVHHAGYSHPHAAVRHAKPYRPARSRLTPRQRTAYWHCNPWHGASRLEGPLFALGKGAWRGRCYEHQTFVARDYRRWQARKWRQAHTGHRHHARHDWLRNADLRHRVR